MNDSCVAEHTIFWQVMVDSLQDESVGVVYEPKALISALEMQLGYSA